MNLHELTSDAILEELERRSDLLSKAEMEAGMKEASLKAWEASTALSYRDSGMSMAEAERRVRGGEWASMYKEVVSANVNAAKAKRDHQRAMIAAELWRTEAATRRKI